jgi:hypothetical protein
MQFKIMIPVYTAVLLSCQHGKSQKNPIETRETSAIDGNPYPNIASIPLPAGFKRIACENGSYACWLKELGLKPDKTVHLYDGTVKPNQDAQFAVIDLSVGNKNLQQCADAVMRLRAEYFYSKHQYDSIVFFDNNQTAYRLTAPFTRLHFLEYMEKVFGMCGSASLSRQLRPVADLSGVMPGDVLVRGGFPGHAETVMDVAINEEGKKIYLLSQSYMPAQDIHVLVNPLNLDYSPWYEVTSAETIVTPEYVFKREELKRW